MKEFLKKLVPWHIHTWDKWQTSYYQLGDIGTNQPAGREYVQQKTCKSCGKTMERNIDSPW